MEERQPAATILSALLRGASGEFELSSPPSFMGDDVFLIDVNYRDDGKPDSASKMQIRLSRSGPNHNLPLGSSQWQVRSTTPTEPACLGFGFGQESGRVDIQSTPDDTGSILDGGTLRLFQGTTELTIGYPIPTSENMARPFQVILRFDPKGAYPYEWADYDAGNGEGQRPLQIGENIIDAKGTLKISLSQGKCSEIKIGWNLSQY